MQEVAYSDFGTIFCMVETAQNCAVHPVCPTCNKNHTHTIFDTIISFWKLMVSSLAPGNVSTSGTPHRPSVPCSSSGTAASQLPKEGKLKVSAFGSVGPRRNPASQGPIPATAGWIGILLCWLSHCPICSIKEIWLET